MRAFWAALLVGLAGFVDSQGDEVTIGATVLATTITGTKTTVTATTVTPTRIVVTTSTTSTISTTTSTGTSSTVSSTSTVTTATLTTATRTTATTLTTATATTFTATSSTLTTVTGKWTPPVDGELSSAGEDDETVGVGAIVAIVIAASLFIAMVVLVGFKIKQKQENAEVHQAFNQHRASMRASRVSMQATMRASRASMRTSRKAARKTGIAFAPIDEETALSAPVYAEPIDAEPLGTAPQQPNVMIDRNTGVPQLMLSVVSEITPDVGGGCIEVDHDEDGDHFHADQPIDHDLLMALHEEDITEAV